LSRLKTAAALLLAASLGACATDSNIPKTTWKPRTDADLKADLAACKKDADAVNFRSAEGYTDSRYGAAAAMTSQTDRNDITNTSIERMYDAINYACMTQKGWMPVN
jgi:hypothetical protein